MDIVFIFLLKNKSKYKQKTIPHLPKRNSSISCSSFSFAFNSLILTATGISSIYWLVISDAFIWWFLFLFSSFSKMLYSCSKLDRYIFKSLDSLLATFWDNLLWECIFNERSKFDKSGFGKLVWIVWYFKWWLNWPLRNHALGIRCLIFGELVIKFLHKIDR